MKSSGQKAGFAIAAMIVVIVSAGIGVDWWDAHHGGPLPKPGEMMQGGSETVKRLTEENERLKTENALLSLKNDELNRQIEELKQKPAEAPKTAAEPGQAEPGQGRVD